MVDPAVDNSLGGAGEQIYSVNGSNLTIDTVHTQIVTQLINTTDPPDGSKPYHIAEQVFIGIFLTALIILSVGGNILVCVAILTDR